MACDRRTLGTMVALAANRSVCLLAESNSCQSLKNGNRIKFAILPHLRSEFLSECIPMWYKKWQWNNQEPTDDRTKISGKMCSIIEWAIENYLDYRLWNVAPRNRYSARLSCLSVAANCIVDATIRVYPNQVHASNWSSWQLCPVIGQYRSHWNHIRANGRDDLDSVVGLHKAEKSSNRF